MMNKKYQAPQVYSLAMEADGTLLAGSIQADTNNLTGKDGVVFETHSRPVFSPVTWDEDEEDDV